jgi:O-antigen/teichoic acid export membrane protein
MSLRRTLPAGVVDAGVASLATFAVGLTATRILTPAELGVYAVFFTAFQFGSVVPTHLVYLPAEILSVDHARADRMQLLRGSLRTAPLPSSVTVVAVLLATAVTWGGTSTELRTGLTLTTAAVTLLAPAQEHARRLLHLAGLSWHAATVSVMHLFVVLGSIAVMHYALDIGAAWIPFGALAIANVASLTTAVLIAIRASGGRSLYPGLRRLASSGRWLVVVGAVPAAAAFLVATLISALAGNETLGHAEAARIAAQPIVVVSVGLSWVLGPRSMEAANRRDRRAARRIARMFLVLLALATLGFLALAGHDQTWNPLAHLIPAAYTVTGLTAVTILANLVRGVVFPHRSELLGGHREKHLSLIEVLASVAMVAAAATASVTGAFARPMSLFAQGGWRAVHYRRALEPLYEDPGSPDDGRDAREGPDVFVQPP